MSMTIQQAINQIAAIYKATTARYHQAICNGIYPEAEGYRRDLEAEQMALAALREKADRENPQPLALEELRQMEGAPVFLVVENIAVYRWAILDFSGDERTCFQNGLRLSNEVYGITWSAYRHKPKEG